MASVSIGRRRLPPEEIRWLATSGIMVTSEPVRDRIVALTRSISAATSATSSSIEAPAGLSKGTITATLVSTFAQLALSLVITIERAGESGKGTMRVTGPCSRQFGRQRRPEVAGIVRYKEHIAGLGGGAAA